MSKLDSNQFIKHNQIVFSQEILDYFKSIETPENKKWIEKYFKVLSDPSNFTAEKYNIHHIRPCFTFKDENHKSRKETKKLGDKFSNNLIRLSIYNHLLTHYYLWKIFNTNVTKVTFQRMIKQSQFIEKLSEKEIKDMAQYIENCSSKNQTHEQIKEKSQLYNNNINNTRYYDHFKQEFCSKRTLYRRLKLYGNISIDEFKTVSINDNEYIQWKESITKPKSEYYINRLELRKQKRHQICFDPIKQESCYYGTLENRIRDHKTLYKNIILDNCVIK